MKQKLTIKNTSFIGKKYIKIRVLLKKIVDKVNRTVYKNGKVYKQLVNSNVHGKEYTKSRLT